MSYSLASRKRSPTTKLLDVPTRPARRVATSPVRVRVCVRSPPVCAHLPLRRAARPRGSPTAPAPVAAGAGAGRCGRATELQLLFGSIEDKPIGRSKTSAKEAKEQ
ncbi:hypothetical protein EVAR_16925_1 [Eumeta japonica]|uniref:Uncharacterized protein n=1 Tax=Eumeta variegata TaxID=151549 RepID=A0A4C1TVB5_EUMVA|nr:hypothetical protein EVAR_16925_1 [Eumeta japonica]